MRSSHCRIILQASPMSATIVYIGIPRTASTAVRKCISVSNAHGQRHLPASCYPSADVRIATVRNPFSRAVSLFCLANPDDSTNISEFRRWVRDGLSYNDTTILQTDQCAETIIKRSGAWLCCPQSIWLDLPTTICAMESLPDSLYQLCDKYSIHRRRLTRINVSGRCYGCRLVRA